ncbi:hypothetical protein A7A78_02160 [Aequorivita soesokkakensis]|uniref:Uncharacterized protein n=1 Tax=Aequorivita soesokkakensis TaxID=1385699 RepID=A0A1A9LJP7_9FLAO|nr:hypothetical protein A7A78_02160 [Aequorivita soesokkakensis]
MTISFLLGLARNRTSFSQNVVLHYGNQPHKQHFWFFPTRKPTLKKPKELFFANALMKLRKTVIE